MKKVGKILAPHGLRGELYILVFSGDPFWLEDVEECEIVNPANGQKRKLLCDGARPHKKGLLMTFEEIEDRTQAESVQGWEFYIPEEFFVSEPGEALFLGEVEGFKVIDAQAGDIGLVTGFNSVPGQDLLIVKGAKETYDIPFVEAFIERIDIEGRTLYMKLPEGLLDLPAWNESNKKPE